MSSQLTATGPRGQAYFTGAQGFRLSAANLAAPMPFYRFVGNFATFAFAPPAMAVAILLPTSSAAAFSGSAAQ